MLVPIIVAILVYCLPVNRRLIIFLSVRRANLILRVYESIIALNSAIVDEDSSINIRQ
jgi:hypothetical protein